MAPRAPRIFLVRHGETQWSKSGQYTGKTDLPLLPEGKTQVQQSADLIFGSGRLIDPETLAHAFVSPRKRAQETWKILAAAPTGGLPAAEIPITITEELAEWDYGLYEGKLTWEIRKLRQTRGLDQARPWDIWRDGCEEGETPEQVTSRLDELIVTIKDLHRPNMHGEAKGDVVLVGHGHILRAFVKRWLRYDLEFPLSLVLEPGGVGGLSYQHNDMDEPALLFGMSLPHPASTSG